MPKRRVVLGDVLLQQRLAVAQCHREVRTLAQDVSLPERLRDECAELALRLARLGRALAAEAAHRLEGGA